MVIDLSGQRVGKWQVLWAAGRHGTRTIWAAQCDCGRVRAVRADHMRAGLSKSCGCKRINTLRHGHSAGGGRSPEYVSYSAAKSRCSLKSHPHYKNYGGRGIEFRFAKFDDFLAHVGTKPTPEHTIDRIDTNGHYEVGNVRWATRIEQAHNKRGRN